MTWERAGSAVPKLLIVLGCSAWPERESVAKTTEQFHKSELSVQMVLVSKGTLGEEETAQMIL